MPYANNNGVKIYYEVEGEGPPLVLAHGVRSQRPNGWRRSATRTRSRMTTGWYCLTPGATAGVTDLMKSSAYGPTMADDVLAVLDELGIDRAHLHGILHGGLGRLSTGDPACRPVPSASSSEAIAPYGDLPKTSGKIIGIVH